MKYKTQLQLLVFLFVLSIWMYFHTQVNWTFSDDTVKCRIDPDSVSPAIQFKAQSVSSRDFPSFSDQNGDQLNAGMSSEDFSRFIHTLFELSMRRRSASDSLDYEFLRKKFERRTFVQPPPWFGLAISKAKVQRGSIQPYSNHISNSAGHRSTFSTNRVFVSVSRGDKDIIHAVLSDGRSFDIEVDLKTSDFSPVISAEWTGQQLLVLLNDNSSGYGELVSLDLIRSNVAWKKQTFGSEAVGNAQTFHYSSVITTESDLILTFGAFSGTLYIEAYDLSDGTFLGRFSSEAHK